MKTKFPTLYTSRLILRPLEEHDDVVLQQIYQSEEVLRYFPNPQPPSLEKVQRFISAQQTHWEQHGYGDWGILPEGETEIIGWAGLQYLPELEETEVGFLLDRPFWGKGYATEVALASLNYGFENFTFDHIIALVHPDNLASLHVIEKCKMKFRETLSLWGMKLMCFQLLKP